MSFCFCFKSNLIFKTRRSKRQFSPHTHTKMATTTTVSSAAKDERRRTLQAYEQVLLLQAERRAVQAARLEQTQQAQAHTPAHAHLALAKLALPTRARTALAHAAAALHDGLRWPTLAADAELSAALGSLPEWAALQRLYAARVAGVLERQRRVGTLTRWQRVYCTLLLEDLLLELFVFLVYM